ncbi:MAG: hypothetical protein U0N32_05490 [Oscillospiraceae bacterium]
MIKRIGRRFVSLLLTFVTILTMLPAMTLPALAASSGNVPGLTNKNIGLSFSGTADDAWSASDTKIVGSAKSTDGSCGSTDDSSTLTITNKKSTTATLSFDYAIEQNSGTIQVDGTAVTTNGNFSKELAQNASIKVYIKSGSISAATKITMTNVKLIYDTEATVTFLPAEHGSYTVGSTTGSTTITGKWTHTQRSTTAYQVKATPAAGYQFMDWYDVGNKKSISRVPNTELNIEENCTIKARFTHKDLALFETGGQVFDDLNEAIAEAQKKLPAIITLAESGKITGNYTIPSKVTLLIPFDEAKTCYTSTPTAITSAPTAKPFRTLTMAAGSSLTLASGAAISIGGQYYAASGGASGKMVGPYGYIKMESGSAIDVQSGASLYAWGFISGSGSVTVQSGGSVYEWYQILDFRGGSASSDMGNKVFPFSQYAVQNVEVPLTLHAGASETAYTAVYAIRKINPTSIPFIGDKGMFKLVSGSLTKAYDGATDRIHYTIDGVAEVNSLNLKLGSMSVSSSSYVLPFTNNMTVDLTSDSKLTINQTASLLPGVETTIAKGAELVVSSGKSIYIYDRDEWVAQNFVTGGKFKAVPYTPETHYNRTDADLKDVKMDVNGSVTAIGAIYTTASGADICSSNKTGKYVQQGNPGTETKTYQYTQNNSSVTAHEIPITAAKLKNADGKYIGTKDAKAGDTFTYCKCQDCGNGTWVKDVAAIINNGTQGDTYSTLEAAVKAYSPDNTTAPTNYIKLLHNTTEKTISVSNKSLYLDLNGRTVTGDISVTNGYKLYGMDSSAKADYTTAPTGKIVGKVTGYAPTYQTPTVKEEYDRYVAIQGTEADGTSNLSFHRFNISVTGYRFELAAPQCALFFIGEFQGDAEAKKHLTSLGFTLKDGKGTQLGTDSSPIPENLEDIPDMPDDGKESTSEVVRTKDGAFLFEAYLKRSFDRNSTDKTAYTEKISATAQAMFKNNGTQDSEPKLWSFEDAWKNAEGLTPEQKAILKNFLPDLDFNP